MISYTQEGQGFPIVFLHGFCESKEIWTSFIEPFKTEYQVITIDIPGYGMSSPLEQVSMESWSESIFTELLRLGLEKWILVGHSMGGYVALAMAERHSSHVAGLCLFHSTAYADSEEKQEQRNKTLRYVQEHGVEAFIKPFVPPLFFSKNRKKLQQEIEDVVSIGLGCTPTTIEKSIEAMRDRPDRTHVLSEAQFPILYMIGKNDQAVPLESSLKQLALIPLGQALILGETAHMGMFEEKSHCQYALLSFVQWVSKGLS